jgi:hypothetical protein
VNPFNPRNKADSLIKMRIDRLEADMILALTRIRKMAQGQAHFEQSFQNLQNSITDLGRRLDGAVQAMVAAHDSGDDKVFDDHANALDAMVNEVQNLGTGGNTATTAGASPTTTAGTSTGDLPQGAGPTQSGAPEPATTDTPPPTPASG